MSRTDTVVRVIPPLRPSQRSGSLRRSGGALRAFGHVRQLDRVLDQTLSRAWAAGAGPGDARPSLGLGWGGPPAGRTPPGRVLVQDTTCDMSISLDGFVAGPEQGREDPLGKRGRELHLWHLGDERANEADETAAGWLMRPRGAYVMGRNMFGPIRGEWEEDWRGWWGPEPPYHARCSCSPITLASRSRWTAARPPFRHRRIRRRLRAGARDRWR